MSKPTIQNVGVAWIKETKNKKEVIKISINKEIFIAYKNNKKGDNELAPDYVVVKFLDKK